jgi:hypothetical protein
MYPWLVYLHILSAVASIGPFFVLIPLLRKMKTAENAELQLHLDSFQFAVRLSKHTGHLLVATGVLLMWLGNWPWKTSWILATIIVMVTSLYFIARAFSPTIRELRKPTVPIGDRNLLLRKLSRALYLYIALLLVMMWFMVVKPTFG